MFLFGPPNVDKMKARRNVKGLIKALGYIDVPIRWGAAHALGELGDARAVDPLIAALKDAEVRKAAAEALGKIGDVRALKPLLATLRDSDLDVREAVVEALDQIGYKPGKYENAAWYWIAKKEWDQCVALGAPALKPLLAVLKDSDLDVRKAAAYALGKIGDARAVESLVVALKDVELREAASEALGKIGDARAVEQLIAALKDKNEWVRKAAAKALGQIGAPAVEQLIAVLKDKSEWVRKVAAEVLWQISEPAVEPLVAALKDDKWYVRKAAAEILDKLGWKPGKDENAAWYWITKKGWCKIFCVNFKH